VSGKEDPEREGEKKEGTDEVLYIEIRANVFEVGKRPAMPKPKKISRTKGARRRSDWVCRCESLEGRKRLRSKPFIVNPREREAHIGIRCCRQPIARARRGHTSRAFFHETALRKKRITI